MIIGIIATLSGVISSCLTFSKIDNLNIALGLISAVSAGTLTFLNPTKKEQEFQKRLSIYHRKKVRFDSKSIIFNNKSESLSVYRKTLIELEEILADIYDTLEKIYPS